MSKINEIITNPKVLLEGLNNELNDEIEFDDILIEIACKFINYRADNGLTQKQLADKLDISQSMVSKLESGDYNPTIKMLFDIAKKLDWKLEVNINEIQPPIIYNFVSYPSPCYSYAKMVDAS